MSRIPTIVDRPPESSGNGAPPAGEVTGRQLKRNPFGITPIVAQDGSTIHAIYSTETRLSAEDFSDFFPATYATYDAMRSMHSIALARSIVMDPLTSSTWQPVPRSKDTPQEMVDFVIKYVLPLRREIMSYVLRSLDYGWFSFEKVWALRGGYAVWDWFKPLSVRANDILIDPHGNTVGIRPRVGEGDQRQDLGLDKCWVYTYDGDPGDPYGRPRLENIRNYGFRMWVKTALQSERLERKISGILPIIYHPPGFFKDANGQDVAYQTAAVAAMQQIQNGIGITLETIAFDNTDMANNPDILKMLMASPVKVDFYDAKSTSTDQTGMTAKMEYADKLCFRGYLLPERTGIEGKFGNRAESSVLAETGLKGSETVSDDIDGDFSRGPLNDLLVINFGERARDEVAVKTPPLVNAKATLIRALFEKFIGAGLGPALADFLDMKDAAGALDLKLSGREFDASKVVSPPKPTPDDPKPDPNVED